MSKHDDRLYLGNMLDYSRKAHARLAEVTVEEWNTDETLRFATAYLVQVIGEAASRLSAEGRRSLPDLPWKEMIGLRHRLVHGYATIRQEVVWDVAKNKLASLITALEKAIPSDPEP